MNLLRFITAGSVDDGKSTLIGRLLYDSNSISHDIMEVIERTGKVNESGQPDLALLTDGLRAEREQGITIDVAYKYFATPKRKFIIADAPGHIQYTRNMVTGASNTDLAIILIDARKGVIEQTKRHTFIASLLGITHLVVAINKMDLVNYDQDKFNNIVEEYKKFVSSLNTMNIVYIPISALKGDNIVAKSSSFSWYSGKSLLSYMEDVVVESNIHQAKARFPVQFIIRPQAKGYHDYRGYAGKIISGIYKKGDTVTVLPSGLNSKIKSIESFGENLEEAFAPMSVILHLEDDIDISRGDTIVKSGELPYIANSFEATICWMSEKPINVGAKLLLQHNTTLSKAVVADIEYKIEVNTLNKNFDDKELKLNDIAKVVVKTAKQIAFDEYLSNKSNGNFILIDESTNTTIAAGMIIN